MRTIKSNTKTLGYNVLFGLPVISYCIWVFNCVKLDDFGPSCGFFNCTAKLHFLNSFKTFPRCSALFHKCNNVLKATITVAKILHKSFLFLLECCIAIN